MNPDDRYPVRYTAAHVEDHSRLSTFFRLLLVLPHLIVLLVWELGVFFTVIAAWFALLFTARHPQGVYAFHARFLRYSTRVNAYLYLVTDDYPAFDGRPDDGYAIQVVIAPPAERYNRWKTGFRIILFIPVYLLLYAMALVAQTGALCSWFVIVSLGRLPKGLQDVTDLGLNYQARATAYLMLMVESWPPIADDSSGFSPAPNLPGPAHPEANPPFTVAGLPGGFEPPRPPV